MGLTFRMGYMEMLFTKRYRYKAVDHQRSRPLLSQQFQQINLDNSKPAMNDTTERIGINNDQFIQLLPMDEERKRYLAYHRDCVFKG